MTTSLKNALSIASIGGAIPSGDWTTGQGNYVAKRGIPAFCREIYATHAHLLKGRSKTAALRLIKKRPRVQKLIVVADWRALNKAAKAA